MKYISARISNLRWTCQRPVWLLKFCFRFIGRWRLLVDVMHFKSYTETLTRFEVYVLFLQAFFISLVKRNLFHFLIEPNKPLASTSFSIMSLLVETQKGLQFSTVAFVCGCHSLSRMYNFSFPFVVAMREGFFANCSNTTEMSSGDLSKMSPT